MRETSGLPARMLLPSAELSRNRRGYGHNDLVLRTPLMRLDHSAGVLARALGRLAGAKTWLVIPGADHNELVAREKFWQDVATFLAQR